MQNEILLQMRFQDGTERVRFFNTCEEAWMDERETRRKFENKRAKADRKYVSISFYVGCTSTGKTYGGILHGFQHGFDIEEHKRDRKKALRIL